MIVDVPVLNADLLSTAEVATTLGFSCSHCRELAGKLLSDGVVDALMNKRQGQKQDYRVGPEIKAEIRRTQMSIKKVLWLSLLIFAIYRVTGYSENEKREIQMVITETVKSVERELEISDQDVDLIIDSKSPTGKSICIKPEMTGKLLTWQPSSEKFKANNPYTFYVWLKAEKKNPDWEYDHGTLMSVVGKNKTSEKIYFKNPEFSIGLQDKIPSRTINGFQTVKIDNPAVRNGIWHAFRIGSCLGYEVTEIALLRKVAATSHNIKAECAGFFAIPDVQQQLVVNNLKYLSQQYSEQLFAYENLKERFSIINRDKQLIKDEIKLIEDINKQLENIKRVVDKNKTQYIRLFDNPLENSTILTKAEIENNSAYVTKTEQLLNKVEQQQKTSAETINFQDVLLKDEKKNNDYIWKIGLDAMGYAGQAQPHIIKEYGLEGLLAAYRYVIDSNISPAEDKFNFSWFDEEINRRKDKGLKTIINCMGGHNAFYPPQWFCDKYKEEFNQLDWKGQKGANFCQQGINIWHKELRDFIRKYLSELGKYMKDNPHVSYYVIAAEVSQVLVTKQTDGQLAKHEPGYSDVAKKAFRRYLQKKYHLITALNQDWGCAYNKFEEITPPPGSKYVKERKASPLVYWFELFRRDSFAEYLQDCYQTLKEADPNHPVVIGATFNYFDGSLINGCDTFKTWSKAGDAICRGALGGGGHPGDLAQEFNYGYSLARFFPDRPCWVDEFHDETPEAWGLYKNKVSEDTPENQNILNAVMRRNLWQGFSWGNRRMLVFTLAFDPSWGGGWLDYRFDQGGIVRPCSAAIPVVKKYMEKFEAVTRKTIITQPEIGILIPKTSMLVANPANMQAQEAWIAKCRLFDEKFSYFFIPEEVILDGRETLESYKVIFMPYATCFPAGMTEKVLAFIKQGGLLVCSGPPGVYNSYGQKDMELLHTIFSDKMILSDNFEKSKSLGLLSESSVNNLFNEDSKRQVSKFFGEYWSSLEKAKWAWMADNVEKKDIKLSLSGNDNNKYPGLLVKKYGKGRIFVSLFGMSQITGIQDAFINLVKETIPIKQIDADFPKQIDIILREIPQTSIRYLFLTNISATDKYTGEIRIGSKCKNQVLDLTGNIIRQINASYKNGYTHFDLSLEPGHFSVVRYEED